VQIPMKSLEYENMWSDVKKQAVILLRLDQYMCSRAHVSVMYHDLPMSRSSSLVSFAISSKVLIAEAKCFLPGIT